MSIALKLAGAFFGILGLICSIIVNCYVLIVIEAPAWIFVLYILGMLFIIFGLLMQSASE